VFLIDTNVLVYAYDAREPEKRFRAIEVLSRLASSELGLLSVQVVNEFYNVITTRHRLDFGHEQARDAAETFLRSWPVFDLTVPIVFDALRLAVTQRLSCWDALIWATAKHNAVQYLLSEDLNDGQVIEGVRILNPFLPSFDLRILD
jgi:predicted nucleic acid-binding protein